ncbi:putative phage repressor [Pseudogulbenkiania sp. NH8B]|uniref:XRE family transcriptional regulator n=1 Tax=Pseudogulbenkiania sp. (strain NH8B) TaxID=748280 RepID=UPI000227957F|nr:LexA family transcriptional regulator [Pseudogulbenkiania sp. NH8B]BAK75410.1 putative phage repressor [Pseudogulbenkiania sp. NH8B]
MIKIGKRIAGLRAEKGWSQRDLAKRCGWETQSRIGNYEQGTREPSLLDIDTIAKALGITARELLFGSETEPTDIGRVTAWADEADLDKDSYVMVDRYDLKLSAGCGSIAWVVHEKDPLAFRTRFIQARRLDPRNLKAMYVRGDSMEPYLQDGDTVMIDIEDTKVVDGEVYAVCYDDEWYIKRLYKTPGGGLLLHSDNSTKHPDKPVTPEQAELVRVFGRVVWRGG